MSDSIPESRQMTTENGQPMCAHLRVSYRTENYEGEVRATENHPGGRHMLTRGWWECDYNCGTKFFPHYSPAADRPVENSRWTPDSPVPVAHHILCNGDPNSPVRGCRWCDGEKGLWATHPYAGSSIAPTVENSELRKVLHDYKYAAIDAAIAGGDAVTPAWEKETVALSKVEELFASREQVLTEESRAAFTAEISRLRANRLTPEEARELVRWVASALGHTGWKLITIEQRAIDKLSRLSSEGNPK